MTDLLQILTELSQVLGVPAALCLAWGAFILREHARRITKLEERQEKETEKLDEKLNAIYNRVNDLSQDVALIKGKLGVEK